MLIEANIYHFLNLTEKTIYFKNCTIENIPNTPID